MQSAIADLHLEHLWVVYPGRQEYTLHDRISVVPMETVKHQGKDLLKLFE
jgi:hypothetical protein